MASKDKNPKQSESSLLLKMPSSMFSLGDMSGNPFLMPVAVNNSVGEQVPVSNAGMISESSEGSQNETEGSSVCQLEQPLLLRKTSPSSGPPAHSFPTCNESVSQSIPSYHGSSIHASGFQAGPSSLQNTLQSQLPTQSKITYAPQPYQASFPYHGQPPDSHSIVSSSQPTTDSSYQQIASNTLPPATDAPPSLNQSSAHFTFGTHSDYTGPYIMNNSIVTSVLPTIYASDESVIPATASLPFYQTSDPKPPSFDSFGTSKSTASLSDNTFTGNNVYPQHTMNTFASSTDQNNGFSVSSDQINNVECTMRYVSVKPHWLFCDTIESKEIWFGFSRTDSERLEIAFHQDKQTVVPTDGGRYDAYLGSRVKKSVYFDAKDLPIRRCTWFHQTDSSQKFVPFEEDASGIIEQHYYNCVSSGQWQKRINIPEVGSIILESPEVMLHYKNELEVWPTLPDSRASPKTLKRGLPEGFELMPDEASKIDHLVFIVQGIGSFCDLRFRTVSQCVDGFRDIANRLISTHFKHVEHGKVGRVEFLPLAWHAKLHNSDVGLDCRMQRITLPSISKLRHFTNDTLLDILLYSSPQYCQSILDTVASELNRLFGIFVSRNPDFTGEMFVAGHSLGSLILFDILANQKLDENECDNDKRESEENDKQEMFEGAVIRSSVKYMAKDAFPSIESLLDHLQLQKYTEIFLKEQIDVSTMPFLSDFDFQKLGLPLGARNKLMRYLSYSGMACQAAAAKELDAPVSVKSIDQCVESDKVVNLDEDSNVLVYPMRTNKSGMSLITYPRLNFKPAGFFALGSPISMFLAVRGYDKISEDFKFPTCPGFFHIFHPYDPVAFRIEPLIDPNFTVKPVMIPHHKGRKRMHLEIRENLTKVGIEIKQKFIETLRYTWNSLSGFAAHAFPSAAVEAEMEKIVKQQISENEDEAQGVSETSGEEIQIGCLNNGRRIDFVLQEKPIEALNDYIFALTSHATYWDSEDTVLMILREIYALQGIVISNESKHLSYSGASNNSIASLSSATPNAFTFESVKAEHQFQDNISTNYNIVPNVPTHTLNTNFGQSSDSSISSASQMQSVSQPQPVGPPPLSGFVKKSPFGR